MASLPKYDDLSLTFLKGAGLALWTEREQHKLHRPLRNSAGQPDGRHRNDRPRLRLLAKRYHPDNSTSGDPIQFNVLQKSYDLLSNPERRAQYDVTYDEEKGHQWRIFDQGSAEDGREQDRRIFHGVLSLLYVARRRNPDSGGLGAVHIERMLGVPREHLEFPLWYLKRRGWIESLMGGQLAITVDGVDVLGSKELSLPHDRLLSESSLTRSSESHGHRLPSGSGQPPSTESTSDEGGTSTTWSSSARV